MYLLFIFLRHISLTENTSASKSIPQYHRDNFLESNGSPPLPPPPLLDSPNSSSPVNEALQPFGMPSLPEPTEKPPPPPLIHQDEPIYEAIQPRNDLSPISKVLSIYFHFIFALKIKCKNLPFDRISLEPMELRQIRQDLIAIIVMLGGNCELIANYKNLRKMMCMLWLCRYFFFHMH